MVGIDGKTMRSTVAPGPVAEALEKHGLNLVFVLMPDPGKLPPIISLKHVDGVIVQGVEPVDGAAKSLRKMPTVWMMTRRSNTFWADYVQPDNEANGQLAARHLLEQGHRHLAIINVQPNYPAFATRTQACVAYARANGATAIEPRGGIMDPSPILHVGGEGVLANVEGQVRALLETKPRPTGLFLIAPRELIALQLFTVVFELKKRGLDVGKDMSVVVGDYSPEWMTNLNYLSACIDVQIPLIAERAVEQLMWRIQNIDAPGPVGVSMPPRLVVPSV